MASLRISTNIKSEVGVFLQFLFPSLFFPVHDVCLQSSRKNREMGTRLFIGNVSYNTTERTLRGLFEDRGLTVKDVVIVTDQQTGRSRGFGFVDLSQAVEAQQALDLLNGEDLEGKRISIRKAFERGSQNKPRRLDHEPRQNMGGERKSRKNQQYRGWHDEDDW